MQTYNARGASYANALQQWVDNGADVNDYTLVDFASGVVNRGCHDAPNEGSGGTDPCGNGELHARDKRRDNFRVIWEAMEPTLPAHVSSFDAKSSALVINPGSWQARRPTAARAHALTHAHSLTHTFTNSARTHAHVHRNLAGQGRSEELARGRHSRHRLPCR